MGLGAFVSTLCRGADPDDHAECKPFIKAGIPCGCACHSDANNPKLAERDHDLLMQYRALYPSNPYNLNASFVAKVWAIRARPSHTSRVIRNRR